MNYKENHTGTVLISGSGIFLLQKNKVEEADNRSEVDVKITNIGYLVEKGRNIIVN